MNDKLRNKAIFYDRDGVVNKRLVGDYVKSISELELKDEIFSAIKTTKENGYLAVLITNQRCIGRGIISNKELNEIHTYMQQVLIRETGFQFDAIYFCPHDISDNCSCRKPKPGMILQASLEHNINLENSLMIGDSDSDIEAGISAGCKTGFLQTPEHKEISGLQGKGLLHQIPNFCSNNLIDILEQFFSSQ